MKKILITGVAGFVGSNLAACLLEQGHEVFGIDNFSFGERTNMDGFIDHPAFSFREVDLASPEALEGLKVDSIVHLASHKIPRYTSAFETLATNNKMLNAVIEKAHADDSHLLFASTSDIYGKNPDLPYKETSNSVLGPTTVKRWAYATSKIYSEQLIQAWHQDFGLRYTIMRFFGSYGPNQNRTWWGGPQSVFIEKILEGQALEVHGDGQQTRTFTYIEDTVQGIARCVNQDEAVNDIFNIAGEPDTEICILDLAHLVAELMEENQPEVKLIPYATFGNYEDVRRRVPCINKIKEKLGYRPKMPLREGLIKTIAWQRAMFEGERATAQS